MAFKTSPDQDSSLKNFKPVWTTLHTAGSMSLIVANNNDNEVERTSDECQQLAQSMSSSDLTLIGCGGNGDAGPRVPGFEFLGQVERRRRKNRDDAGRRRE